jgi:peptide/nickel transport system substrate-binding protein
MWYPYQEEPDTLWEEKIDKIFNQAARTLNRSKRKELYDSWQKIVSEELPVIYTVIPASVYAVRNRFGNLYPTVYGGPFGEIEYVYFKNTN